MTTKDTFLSYKLEKAIARIKTHNGYNNSPLFLEICNCPIKGGSLYYDTKKQTYFGKGSCSNSLLCSKIQIDKHKILMKKTYTNVIETEKVTEKLMEKEHLISFSARVIS